MKRWKLLVLLSAMPALLSAQTPEKKHILFIGASQIYAHDSVSHGMYTPAMIGQESGLFDVRFRTDTERLSPDCARNPADAPESFTIASIIGH